MLCFSVIAGVVVVMLFGVVSLIALRKKKPSKGVPGSLFSFVNLMLEKGYSKEQIEGILLRKGWSKERIDYAFDAVSKRKPFK